MGVHIRAVQNTASDLLACSPVSVLSHQDRELKRLVYGVRGHRTDDGSLMSEMMRCRETHTHNLEPNGAAHRTVPPADSIYSDFGCSRPSALTELSVVMASRYFLDFARIRPSHVAS